MRQRYILVAFILLISILAIALPAVALFTDYYNYNQDIEFINDGDTPIAQSLLFEINAAGLISNGYLQPDADDCTMQYLGDEEFLTAMNLSGTESYWRVQYTRMPGGASAKRTLWFGNPSMTRDQYWIGDDGDTCTVTSPGSFSFSGTQPFAISADIHPLTEVGTSQLIIGKGNSWELTIEPGTINDHYQWAVMSGSGNIVHSVTIAATALYTSSIVSWYNGEYIVIADGTSYAASLLPTGLVTTGSPVYIGHADCALNDLRITTPGSVTPVGGLPPAGSSTYMLGPEPTHLLPDPRLPTNGYSSDNVNAPQYMANGIVTESGWTTAPTCTLFWIAYEMDDYPGASGDIITGVSCRVAGEITVNTAGGAKIISINATLTNDDDPYCDSIYGDCYYYPTLYINLYDNGTYWFDVSSGTRTLTIDNQPWTHDALNNTTLMLQGYIDQSVPLPNTVEWDITEVVWYVSYE